MDISGSGSNTVSQQQSALPAWLESLHVGERASRPATNTPKFSTANLIEEGSLPSWMHAQRDETKNVTGANMPVSLRPSSFSAPSTDDTILPANSFAAQSLIDKQALPSWMQEGEIATPLPPEGGVSPARLVDKDSMPDWMKSLQQQQSGASGQGQSPQVASTASTVKKVKPVLPPPSSPAAGLAARDLIDQQSLPSWMTQLSNQNPATPASHERMTQPHLSSQAIGNELPSQPGQRGLAARDLIDQQSLPSWMLPQKSGQNAAPTNNRQEKQSNPPATGLPASSLLDMNALPSWLAENGQAQTVSPAYSQPLTPMVPSRPWSPQEPAVQGSGADVPGGRIAASSVIDMNALPEWLRSSGSQQSVPNISSQSYSAPYAGSPRVENVRVPSRPRGEINSSETSEIAASVFTSMLGVASAAPGFPVSPQQQSGQLSYGEQMRLSGVSGVAGMPVQAGMSLTGIGNPGGVGMAGMQGGPGSQSMAGIPGGSGIHNMVGMQGGPGSQSMAGIPGGSGIHNMAGMQGGPGSQSMAGIPGGSGIHNMAGMQGGPGSQSMAGNVYGNPTGGLPGPSKPGMAGEEKNTKKRGLFGALLDWLSR